MDTNESGTLSLSEFKLALTDGEGNNSNKKKNKRYICPPQMEQDLRKIYEQSDKDNNGIDENELCAMLSEMGINAEKKEIEYYMKKIDSSRDGKIDYDEFRKYILDRMMGDMMNCEDILDDLIKEFKITDINSSGYLNKSQLHQVFKNLGI